MVVRGKFVQKLEKNIKDKWSEIESREENKRGRDEERGTGNENKERGKRGKRWKKSWL